MIIAVAAADRPSSGAPVGMPGTSAAAVRTATWERCRGTTGGAPLAAARRAGDWRPAAAATGVSTSSGVTTTSPSLVSTTTSGASGAGSGGVSGSSGGGTGSSGVVASINALARAVRSATASASRWVSRTVLMSPTIRSPSAIVVSSDSGVTPSVRRASRPLSMRACSSSVLIAARFSGSSNITASRRLDVGQGLTTPPPHRITRRAPGSCALTGRVGLRKRTLHQGCHSARDHRRPRWPRARRQGGGCCSRGAPTRRRRRSGGRSWDSGP